MTYLNLYLISLCWVIILDLSGFSETLKEIVGKILGLSPKVAQNLDLRPATCSFCMTWWTGLLYILIIGKVSFLTIAFTLICAYFTGTTKDLLYLVSDILTSIMSKISKNL